MSTKCENCIVGVQYQVGYKILWHEISYIIYMLDPYPPETINKLDNCLECGHKIDWEKLNG